MSYETRSTLAVTLLNDGNIALVLPDGRNIRIPQDERGIAVMRKILAARAIAAEFERPVGLGTTSAPIQYLVDKWIEEQDTKVGGVAALVEAGDF